MNRSLTRLAVTAALTLVTAATTAYAQGAYDPRSAPPGDPRYGDPRADPRYDPRADPRDDPRNDPRYDGPRGRGGASATFYADDRFHGRRITLDHGVRRLGELGMEDKISSIQVNSGRWLVCEDDDFRGRCAVVDRSIGHLDRISMEDKISSVRPIRDDGRDEFRGGNDRDTR